MKLFIDKKDIYNAASSVDWSGDLQQTSRTLKATLEHSYQPEVGDSVIFQDDDGKTLFRGVVMYVDVSNDTVQIEANDLGIYLANNMTFKVYKGTPQAITRQVCAEFGVKLGKIPILQKTRKVTSTGSLSAFKVIEQAYEGKESKGSKQYSFYFADDKLTIEKAGSDNIGNITALIENSGRSESIRDMVNRVVILKDEKKSGIVENEKDRKKYGTFQGVYSANKDDNAQVEAKKELKSISRTGEVSALGDIRCTAGKAIYLNEPKAGLVGRYTIKSDSHRFTSTEHEMNLEFYFDE